MRKLTEVFRPGDEFAYIFSLNGREYSIHWTKYQGISSERQGEHRFLFLSETRMSAVGLGGPDIRIRAELVCNDFFHPYRYAVATNQNVNVVEFGEQITLYLPDGSKRCVPSPSFRCLLGENLGQLAVYLRLAADELDDSHSETFFSLGGVTAFDYSLSRDTTDGWYNSTFLDRLLISDDGWLEQLAIPKDGVTAVKDRRNLPEWAERSPLERSLSWAPAPDARFSTQDLFCESAGASIGMTITIPEGTPPFPTVIFIGGSGAHDRHGIAGQVDLGYHEIVDYLSNNGWLGVRFDTRGAGSTAAGDNLLNYGFEEVLSDARAVIDCVLARSEADSSRVAVIGHSQGALAATEIAASDQRIHSAVLLAMSGRPVEEVLLDQIRVQGKWLGQTKEQIEQQLQELSEFISFVRTEKEWEPENIPPRFFVAKRQRKWYADHLSRDACRMLSGVRIPVLLCQGAKDFQVLLERDAMPLYVSARAAGVPIELAIFPNLDHLFKSVEGESHVSQYYDQTRRVSADLKDRIARFLAETGSMI